MRRERITRGRWQSGEGESAARAVSVKVCAMLDLSEVERAAAEEKIKLRCSYKGTTVPDAPLHSQEAATYEWFVNESSPLEHKTCVNRTVEQNLHHPQ